MGALLRDHQEIRRVPSQGGRVWGAVAACAGVAVLLGFAALAYQHSRGRDEHRQAAIVANGETKDSSKPPGSKRRPADQPSSQMQEREPAKTVEQAKQQAPAASGPASPKTAGALTKTDPPPAKATATKTVRPAPPKPPMPVSPPPAKVEARPEVTVKESSEKKPAPAATPVPAAKPAMVPAESPDRRIEGKTLAEWIEEIRSKDPSKGEKAIRMVLGFSRDRALEAVPVLLADLKQQSGSRGVDTDSRAAAALALGVILGSAAMADPALVEDAVALLTKMLGEVQTAVKNRAAEALGLIGPPAGSAVPSLVRLLHDQSSWETRQAAATALGGIAWNRSGKTSPAADIVSTSLTTALSDPAAAVRLAAIKALVPLGTSSQGKQKSAILSAILSQAQSDHKSVVRIWAHMAGMYIAGTVDGEKIAAIAAFLKDSDTTARIQAAQALAFIGPKATKATPELLATLNAEQTDFVLCCIEALAGICTERMPALPALQEIARDPKRPAAIRRAAQHAVQVIASRLAEKS